MTDDKLILRNALEATIRIGVLLLVAVWCFQIVQPFINLVVWAIIIAIALHPFYGRVNQALGGRRVPAAILVTVVGLLVLLTPTVMLSETFVEGAQQLAGALQEGRLVIPPPRENLTGWSLIDEPLYRFWSLAAANLGDALKQLAPQLRALSGWLLAAVAGVGLGIIKFVLAMIIAGVLLAHAEGGHRFAYAVFNRLAGDRGTVLAGLAEATVRSVARGILGVAVIQALLAGIGFLAAGVPGAGLWALLCLVLGVVQIGPMPILLGAVVYVFAIATTVTAVIFTIWCMFVGVVDNILKPLLLGRGVNFLLAGALLASASSTHADETHARELLQAMSDYLVAQQAISFEYDATLQVVTTENQKLGLASSGTVRLERPDKLRVTRHGGFANVELVFDGRTLTLLGKNTNVHGQVEIAGSIDDLVDTLRDEYQRPVPAADLLMSNVYDELMAEVIDVKDLGSGVIRGVECDHLAFRTEQVDWEIWIAQGDRPYPCRYAITSPQVAGGPQYVIDVREWQTGSEVASDDFILAIPADAKELESGDLPEIGELPDIFELKIGAE